MSIIAWIALGLVAGFIASKVVNKHGSGVVGDIAVGVCGAFIGGFLFNLFGARGVTGFNAWSLVVAALGSVVMLAIYNALGGNNRALP